MLGRLVFAVLFTGILIPPAVSGQAGPVQSGDVVANFLTISPDAVSGGLGNSGVSARSDVYSVFLNPAKYAFSEDKGGIALAYTPWARSYVKGLGLSSVAAYRRYERNTFAFGFRYFSYGSMELTDENAVYLTDSKPYELAVDLAYNMRLSPVFSGAVTFRYIYSYMGDMGLSGTEASGGAHGYAFDVSFFYRHEANIRGKDRLYWNWGIKLSDIGSRMHYVKGGKEYYLPAILKTGLAADWRHGIHAFLMTAEVNKPLIYAENAAGESDRNTFAEIARSFRKWSIRDFYWNFGLEYTYNRFIALRMGYYYEHPDLGYQQYVSFGCGVQWRRLGLDLAYLCNTGKVNALDNIFKISGQYHF